MIVRVPDVEDPNWMAVIIDIADIAAKVGEVRVALLDGKRYEGWCGTAVVSKGWRQPNSPHGSRAIGAPLRRVKAAPSCELDAVVADPGPSSGLAPLGIGPGERRWGASHACWTTVGGAFDLVVPSRRAHLDDAEVVDVGAGHAGLFTSRVTGGQVCMALLYAEEIRAAVSR